MSPEVIDVFKSIESTKEDLLKTKDLRERAAMGPHLVRLPKGLVPQYIKLSPYHEFCWRTIGHIAKKQYAKKENDELEINLLRAQMKIRPEEYYAYALMTTVLAGVAGVAIAIVLMTMLSGFLGFIAYLAGVMALLVIPVGAYGGLMSAPGSKAKSRRNDIDRKLPAAMNFIAALSSANVNIDVIIKELSRQTLYGEIQNEAEWITRDTELLGLDILTAIKRAIHRSPSERFRDFLQGVITTTTSGGQLKPYFLLKSEQYEKDAKLEMRSRVETLGLMAESFVTIGVAFPLFLVIIMAIFAVITPGADLILMLLYVVVGLMIPMIQVGFVVGLTAITGKVE